MTIELVRQYLWTSLWSLQMGVFTITKTIELFLAVACLTVVILIELRRKKSAT